MAMTSPQALTMRKEREGELVDKSSPLVNAVVTAPLRISPDVQSFSLSHFDICKVAGNSNVDCK